LDLALIRDNPKVFLGYSDTTVTHFACFKAGLVTFDGPAITAGFGENGGLFQYMTFSIHRILFSTEPAGRFFPNADGWTRERLDWADQASKIKTAAFILVQVSLSVQI
jgi:muramoyltetrapeptide carboxypeptidase LdcA involved in peptidoglycan recycling